MIRLGEVGPLVRRGEKFATFRILQDGEAGHYNASWLAEHVQELVDSLPPGIRRTLLSSYCKTCFCRGCTKTHYSAAKQEARRLTFWDRLMLLFG